MDGVVFGMDGPNMSGTWFSPRTGDKFTVRDSFFEDNVYKILATDGRCFTLDTINDGGYIQDMGAVDNNGNLINDGGGYNNVVNNNVVNNNQNLLKGMDELELGDDDPTLKEALGMVDDPLNRPLGGNTERHILEKKEEKKEVVDITTSIIDKALGKKELPTIEVKVSFKEYPEKEIQMLRDVMDIGVKDVVGWYINRMDKEDILKRVEEGVIGCFVEGEIGKIEEEKKIERTPEEEKKTERTPEEEKKTERTPEEEKKTERTPRELELDIYKQTIYKPKPKKGGLKPKK